MWCAFTTLYWSKNNEKHGLSTVCVTVYRFVNIIDCHHLYTSGGFLWRKMPTIMTSLVKYNMDAKEEWWQEKRLKRVIIMNVAVPLMQLYHRHYIPHHLCPIWDFNSSIHPFDYRCDTTNQPTALYSKQNQRIYILL